jgi:hypothetical protein
MLRKADSLSENAAKIRLALEVNRSKDEKALAARLLALLPAETAWLAQCNLVERLADTRERSAVEPIFQWTRNSNEFPVVITGFSALERIGNDEALQALIILLDRDYSKVRVGKPSREAFPEILSRRLHRMTGQDFGTNSKAWNEWLHKHGGHE